MPLMEAVPPGVTTEIGLTAELLTTAVMVVELTTVNELALKILNFTAVAPVKFCPVIVMIVPFPTVVGVTDVITGAGINTNPGLVAVPKAFVTLTSPDNPAPKTAVIVVEFTILNEAAATPPKLTAVVPVKLIPVIVTIPPCNAEVGLNENMIGIGAYVKPGLVPVPKGVVTLTSPEEPFPTLAVIVFSSMTVTDEPNTPPKRTLKAPLRLFPLMVTSVPLNPEVGLNDVITGGPAKTNPDLVPEPAVLDTLISPLTPVPTIAVIVVLLTTVKLAAGVPPKLTADIFVKLVPVIVTVAPAAA